MNIPTTLNALPVLVVLVKFLNVLLETVNWLVPETVLNALKPTMEEILLATALFVLDVFRSVIVFPETVSGPAVTAVPDILIPWILLLV